MGVDVTEFKCSFGKAHLAPVYDFGSKEIVAHSVSESPILAQREETTGMHGRVLRAWFSCPPPPFLRDSNGVETGLGVLADLGRIFSSRSGGRRSVSSGMEKSAVIFPQDQAQRCCI